MQYYLYIITQLNARYLKEIQDKKQYIINFEQKLIRVEEVRDSLQLYSSYEINGSRKISSKSSIQGESRLPMQSYTLTSNGDRCWSHNIEQHSQEWQKVQKSKTTLPCINNNNQQQTMPNISSQNRFDLQY